MTRETRETRETRARRAKTRANDGSTKAGDASANARTLVTFGFGSMSRKYAERARASPSSSPSTSSTRDGRRAASSEDARARGVACRVCLEPGDDDDKGPLESLGCDCAADVRFAHESCAARWFAPKTRGVAVGRALAREWSLTWSCACEICGAALSRDVTRRVVRFASAPFASSTFASDVNQSTQSINQRTHRIERRNPSRAPRRRSSRARVTRRRDAPSGRTCR